MKDLKSIHSVIETEIVSQETGEVLDSRIIKKYKATSEPDFIKVYLKDIIYLHDMPSSLHAILYELLRIMDYKNIVSLSAGYKVIICERLGIAKSTLNNALSAFTKCGICSSIGKGMFVINPYLFGKGKFEDILSLRLNIEYKLEGKTFSTEIKKKSDQEINEEENANEI